MPSHAEHAMLDLTAGSIGGMSGIIIGQPFDTVKVRLQTHSSFYKGPLDCARITIKNEGFLGLFKGLSSPLFGNAWTNAIVFSTYAGMVRFIEKDSDSDPSLQTIVTAGTIAGFCQAVAVCPTELVKCRLQVQDGHADTKYQGPIDCVKHMYKRCGIRGLFIGWWPTVWREAPSFGVYFAVYELVKRMFPETSDGPSMLSMLIAGGAAGVISWGISYPVDVIKSSVQTLPEDAPVHQRKMVYQAKRLYRTGGIRAFSNGLGTTLLRAFPVNAVTLSVYELSLEQMHALFLDADDLSI